MVLSKLGTFVKANRIVVVTTVCKQSGYRHNSSDLVKRYERLQKQHFRLKIQNRAAKSAPYQAFLQVVGHGARGDSRSVVLCTDQVNYIFNCGEGMQRLSNEYHIKLSKLEHIFVTRPTWTQMGGIPGVALTVKELGLKSITLHGPKDSIGIMEATRNFMLLHNFTVKSADTSRAFSDPILTVDYVLLQRPNTSPRKDFSDSSVVIENFNFYSYEFNGIPLPSRNKRRILNCHSETEDLIVYICRLSKKKSIDFNKRTELKNLDESLLTELKEGNNITLADDTVIRYQDIVEWDSPIFIIVECPDEKWIPLITCNPSFTKYQDNLINKNNEVQTIVHFTPEHVLNNSKYKKWMHKFGPNTIHLILNEENTGYHSETMHKMQHQLHLIHPEVFPFFENKKHFVDSNSKSSIDSNLDEEIDTQQQAETHESDQLDLNFLQEGLKVRRCKTLDKVHLRPNKGLDCTSNINIYPKQYIQELMDTDGLLDSLADLQTEINAKTKALKNVEEYPKLLMLGTGSSIPNKVRNTSGMLLQIEEDKSILLDCGESTFNQLFTFFGKTEIDKILRSIKVIYISHLHADHHLGLIGLLKQRKQVTDEPLILLAPQQISSYLHYYHERFDPIEDHFRLFSNRDISLNQPILPNTMIDELHDSLNVRNISTTFVRHCSFAYAVAITLKDGRKICYSGDTMPCDKLVELARNSFLLIHEATMEDNMERDASSKRHSTFSQAVNIGVKADANFTLLTHFSQRYSKLPNLPDSKRSNIDYNRIGIAYDFMSISLSNLPLLPLFIGTLKVMFQDYDILHRQRAIRRDLAKERALFRKP